MGSFADDGRSLLVVVTSAGREDQDVALLDTGTGALRTVVEDPANDAFASISPSGKIASCVALAAAI